MYKNVHTQTHAPFGELVQHFPPAPLVIRRLPQNQSCWHRAVTVVSQADRKCSHPLPGVLHVRVETVPRGCSRGPAQAGRAVGCPGEGTRPSSAYGPVR